MKRSYNKVIRECNKGIVLNLALMVVSSTALIKGSVYLGYFKGIRDVAKGINS